MIEEPSRDAQRLLQCITKNGKCSNLESLLMNFENAAPLVNTNFGGLYPIHIIAHRSRDQDLERKLRLVVMAGANVYMKAGAQQLTVGHYLCYRCNPMPGLKILKDVCNDLNFSVLLDKDENNLLHSLVHPTESKCNDGLRLMETAEFLYAEQINPKAKNKNGISFWDAVGDKNCRPTVRKYLSQDFLSELTMSEESESELKEQRATEVHEKFTKRLTRDILRNGEDFFTNRKTWSSDKKREVLIKLIRAMDSAFSHGDNILQGGESLHAHLHDSESMIRSNVSRWENNLNEITREIERDGKLNPERTLPIRLYTLYCICDKRVKIWKKFLEQDSWYWVPKGSDPKEPKWSKLRRTTGIEPDFSNLTSCDGWFWRNGLPLRSNAPSYYINDELL